MDLDRASALELKALADARRRENRNGPSAVLHLPSNTSHIADDAKGCSSKAQVQIQGQARPSRSIIRNQASGFEEPLWHTTEDEMVNTYTSSLSLVSYSLKCFASNSFTSSASLFIENMYVSNLRSTFSRLVDDCGDSLARKPTSLLQPQVTCTVGTWSSCWRSN